MEQTGWVTEGMQETDRQPDRQAVVQKRMLGKKDKGWDSRGKFLYTPPPPACWNVRGKTWGAGR